MSFDPARPRYTLPLDGKEYELFGTMALIEAVEYALGRGVVQVAVDVMDVMSATDLAKLLSSVLTACDHKMTFAEAKELLWSKIGLRSDDCTLLRMHLYSFLTICLAPPEKRAEKAKNAGELFGKLPEASRGATTRSSASAS